MPVYEYKCKAKKCGQVFTELARFEDEVQCPVCGRANAEKQMSTTYHPVFVHRKGTFAERQRAAKARKF